MYKPLYYSRPATSLEASTADSKPKERAIIAPFPENTALRQFDLRAAGRLDATRERLETAERQLEETHERIESLERALADTNAAHEQRVREIGVELKDYKCAFSIIYSTYIVLLVQYTIYSTSKYL